VNHAPTTPAEWAAAALKQADTARVRIALVQIEHLRALLADLDTFHRAMDALVTHIDNATGFDAGETSPEDAPWAAALDRLGDARNEIVNDLVAKGLWA
jgi:ATP phosphoribosyltransferase regulatory subunit HisZ